MLQVKYTDKTLLVKGGLRRLEIFMRMLCHLSFLKRLALSKGTTSVKQLAAQFAMGENHYADARRYRDDEFFKRALDLPFAFSEDTIRLYAEQEEKGRVAAFSREFAMKLICAGSVTPEMVVNRYIPVDVDVSPMENPESKKEKAC